MKKSAWNYQPVKVAVSWPCRCKFSIGRVPIQLDKPTQNWSSLCNFIHISSLIFNSSVYICHQTIVCIMCIYIYTLTYHPYISSSTSSMNIYHSPVGLPFTSLGLSLSLCPAGSRIGWARWAWCPKTIEPYPWKASWLDHWISMDKLWLETGKNRGTSPYFTGTSIYLSIHPSIYL